MKNISTLFFIVHFILNSSVAQKTGSQKSGINSKNRSTSHLPKKGTSAQRDNNKNPGNTSPDRNKLNSVTDNPTAENSADSKNNITGIWRGYFVQNSFGFFEDRYKFEVQIAQLANNALNSVTYSYKTTVFYGKAEAKGINTTKTNNIIINELKLVDLKMTEQSEPCLMTCYLEYSKMGELETLTGTYSSRNVNNKSDCGSGTVYLEKKATSDFYKEEFVTKRENELKKKVKPLAKKPSTTNRSVAKTTPPKKATIKPGAEENLIESPEKKKFPPAPETVVVPKKEEPVKTPKPPTTKTLPTPEILKSRSNEILKTITTHSKEFKIDLYDNGEIDGDRISVYHNNELIVSNKTLTDKPISFTIKADENTSVHEFVMVAENLGSIPPNTALMIVTTGEQRYELFVTSTEQKNAVVRIVYQPE
jgi:hypothetical protein